MVHALLPQQGGAEVLKLVVRCRDEWELDHVFSCDERMAQRLKRRQPLPRVDSEYLLHEVYELVDLEPLVAAVFKVERDEMTLTLRSSWPNVIPSANPVLRLAFFAKRFMSEWTSQDAIVSAASPSRRLVVHQALPVLSPRHHVVHLAS